MIEYIGTISRKDVSKLYGRSRCAVLVYQYADNHVAAMPNKLFEYMASGLPVICSDFPLWKDIVEASGVGVCIDPGDAVSLNKEIVHFLDNPDLSQEIGRKGRELVEKEYNWGIEESKLLDLYKELI